jgi:iron complex outermembrane recepter protein
MADHIKLRRIAKIVCACLAMAGPVICLAQQAPAQTASEGATEGSLQEIVVTAQKRAESVQNVPITITTLTGRQMSDANISVMAQLPLVTTDLQINFNSDFVAPYIRGIGTEFANAGLDPSVGLYIDDQYYPRANGGVFSMADINDVEVLKGPQGTLYGRNTVGGAIRINTNEASQQFDARTDYTFGNFGRIAGDAMVNGPITDTLSARVAFDIDTNTGYVHNNYNPSYPTMGNRHQYDIFAKLLWEPTDRFSMHVHFNLFDKKDYEGEDFLPVTNAAPTQLGIALGGIPSSCFYCTPNNFFSSSLEKSHDASNGTTIRADYRFDPMTFSSITGFQHVSGTGFADLDTTSVNAENASSPVNTTNIWTQEFQFVSTLPGPFKYTAGVYLLHAREEYWFAVGGQLIFPYPPNPPNQFLSGDGISTTDSAAVYGETTWAFTDQWDLTLGGRYTNETKDLVGNNEIVYLGNSNGIDPQTILSNTRVDGGESILYRRFTPKIVLAFHPDSDVMLYASWSRGFKSGGYNLPAFGPVNEVKPESVSAFEVGEKAEFSRLRINSALFYDKQNELQVQITDQQTGGTEVVNAATTKIYGAETDIDWVPNQQFALGLGAAFLHARYEDFTGSAYRACNAPLASPTAAQQAQFTAGCGAQGGLGFTLVSGYDFAGNPLTLAPNFSGNIRGTYTLPLDVFNGTVHAQLIESYSSAYTYNPEQTLIESARGLLTANMGWRSSDHHWRVGLYGTNLTNKEYNTNETYQNTGGWRDPGVPREYGVTFGAAWR